MTRIDGMTVGSGRLLKEDDTVANIADLLSIIAGGGSGEPSVVKLFGNTLVEQKTQADAVENVITFSENINAIEIYHSEDAWQTFIVNGLSLIIPSGGYRTPIAGVPASTVTIPAGINCIVGRLV